MVNTYPSGLILRVDVDEQQKVTFMYGTSQNDMTVLLTDYYIPDKPALSQFDILRFIIATPNNEPGVAMMIFSSRWHLHLDAPLCNHFVFLFVFFFSFFFHKPVLGL